MFRLKFKGIHSFVSDRKTNYCHLMQCWHWNTQDGICWFGVMEGLMQLPPSQPVAPFLSAACRDEVFSSFGCYLPSQWVTGSFCADSNEFQNLDLNIDWKKLGLSGKLKTLSQFFSLTSASWLWHIFWGRSVYFSAYRGKSRSPFLA